MKFSLTAYNGLLALSMVACSGRAVDLDHLGNDDSEPGEAMVSTDEAIEEIMVDSERLFWATATGTFKGCRKESCSNSRITYTSDGALYPNVDRWRRSFVSTGEQLLWRAFEPREFLMSCPVSGCAQPNRIFRDPQLKSGPVAAGGYVYWSSTYDIYRCPVAGCGDAPELVAAGERAASGLAVQGDEVYWEGIGGIRSAPTDGSSASVIVVARPDFALGFAVNEERIYWIDALERILSCPRAGCTMDEALLVVATQTEKHGLIVSNDGVYWQEDYPSRNVSLQFCPLEGCQTPTVVIASSAHWYTVDEAYVYWTSSDPGRPFGGYGLRRMPKPAP